MTKPITLRYALDPTLEQVRMLSSHVGAVRYAYNWCVNHVLTNWSEVREGTLNEYVGTSSYALRKALNNVKNEVAPWWEQNSKEAFATGCANASNAFNRYYKKLGRIPNYKRKQLFTETEGVTFTTGTRRLEEGARHFTLPRIGRVRLHERAKDLRWLLKRDARIANVTIRKKSARWFITINVKTSPELTLAYWSRRGIKPARKTGGADLGLTTTVITSDNVVYQGPRALSKAQRKLRRAQKALSRKQGLDKKTGVMPSSRWLAQRERVSKHYARVNNLREDFTHKTSTSLIKSYDVLGLENLHVAGLVRNKRLSRAISDAAWSRLREYCKYKSKLYGSRVVLADRYYPSSKTCSTCGVVKTKLSLNERVFECDSCGSMIDRDLNAAINLRSVAQSCGETLNERGGESTGLVHGSLHEPSETIPNETLSRAQPSKATTIRGHS